MASTTVCMRINSEIKEEAEKIFEELALNMSGAVNIFLRRTVRDRWAAVRVEIRGTSSFPVRAEASVRAGRRCG